MFYQFFFNQKLSISLSLLASFLILTFNSCNQRSEFEDFLQNKEASFKFDSLKQEMLLTRNELNQTDSPTQEQIDDYLNKWENVLAFNNEIIDEIFTLDTTSIGKRVSYFNFLDYAIREAHVGIRIKESMYDFTWNSIIDYYLPIINKTKTNDEFIFLCDEMISVLDDAHTWVGYKKNNYNRSLMLGFKESNGKFIVNGFHHMLISDSLDIGDCITKIDGKRIDKLFDKVKKKTVYSKYPKMGKIFEKRFFRSYYYFFLKESSPEYCNVQLKKTNGMTYNLKLKWYPTRSVRNMYGVRVHNRKKIGIEGKLVDNQKYGYIKIDKWNPDFVPAFDSLFNAMYETDGFILDIRNNFGGDFTNFGQKVLSKFVSSDTVDLYKKFRNSPLYHLYGFTGLHYQDNPYYNDEYYFLKPIRLKASTTPKYEKPVVLLVNGKHFSSNDLFIIAYYELKIGKIAGRLNPFQLLGQPIYIKETPWNNWGLGLSVMVPYSASKKLYENITIPIDIKVPLTRKEIYIQEDPILDSAINYLNSL